MRYGCFGVTLKNYRNRFTKFILKANHLLYLCRGHISYNFISKLEYHNIYLTLEQSVEIRIFIHTRY